MSSFESLLLSSPPGFLGGCKQVISLYNTNKSQFVGIILDLLLSSSSNNSSSSDNKEVVKTIYFIFKALNVSNPKIVQADAKAILEKSTLLSTPCIDDILKAFYSQNTDRTKTSVTADSLHVKDWKVGVTTHSSAHESANTPYVNLNLEAGTGSSTETEKLPLQLSYSDFQNLRQTLSQVSRDMMQS